MNVRLLSLNIDKNMPFSRFQARIAGSLKPYAEEIPAFEQSANMRELFSALQGALEQDGIVLIAVDIKQYIKVKKAFIAAFETEVSYNPVVLNMLENNDSVDDDTRRGMASFPEGAEVFLSNDGMYSGFGLENGSQFIVFVPIDNDRINSILRNGVLPFLSANIKGVDFQSAEKPFDENKIIKTVNILQESGSTVAVNGTRNAEILKSCGDSVDGFDNVFIFTPHVEDKGDVNATEYAAQLAKVSLDLSSANIGASISDIYESPNARFICIAVANDESAVVRKLYMSDSETDDEFIESASVELIELIGEKAMGLKSVGIEITDSTDSAMPEEEKKPAGKKSVIILSSVLGAIIIICAVLGIVYKVQGENGAFANAVKSVFGATQPPTTTAPEGTTAPPVTEPPVQIATVKLSEFMLKDLIELEKNKTDTTEPTSENSSEPSSAPTVETDKGAPAVIKVNGVDIDAKEALARLVMTEMGEGYDVEAVKAQTVVIYTYLKYRDNNFQISGVEISDTYNEEVMAAVTEVFGKYLTYNGEVAITPYFDIAARKTADGSTIFTEKYAYLRSVQVSGNPDTSVEGYKTEKILSADEMKSLLTSGNDSVTLKDDKSTWIAVQEHDASVSSSIGYVQKMSVGGAEMTGVQFMNLLGAGNVLSPCFTVTYNAEKDEFTVTSYGIGYGVGMSKAGANALAVKGTKYDRILSTYYQGTTLSEEENV